MTLLERKAYLDPGAALNVTSGYPEGLSPQWMTDYQLHPPADLLHVPPGEYASVICGWFARFFGCADVSLIPSCTMAFAIAAQALTRSPGGEFIVIDTSYDSYPRLLAAFGARVVYARRDADGNPDPESVRAACTARTRAVVIVCPDNPLGVVTPPAVMERLIAVCKERGLTLLADYCLAAVNPFGRQLPVLPKMASSRGLSWIALGDTSKILGLNGSKFGALIYPRQWRERLEAATSAWFFQHSQYDLAVVASILSDSRFPPYLHQLSGQVESAYLYLRDEVAQPPLAIPPGRRLFRPDRRGRARAGRHIVCPPAGRPLLHAGGAAVLVSRRAAGGAGDQDPGLAEPAGHGDRPARGSAEHLSGGAGGQDGVLISRRFAVLGAALPLAGFVSYIWDMTRGRAEPNRVSWALWASAPLIAFVAEIVQGTTMQIALVTFTLGLGPLLVLLVSFANRGCYWKLARLDVVCGGLSGAAIAAWAMTGRGDAAIALSIAADAFAAVPTVLKSYTRPESESPWTYLASGAGAVITLLTVRHWESATFASYAFPGPPCRSAGGARSDAGALWARAGSHHGACSG